MNSSQFADTALGGSALGDTALGGTARAGTAFVDIDLLPAHYRRSRLGPIRLALVVLLAAWLLGLAPAYRAWQTEAALTSARRAELARLQADLTRRQTGRDGLARLDEQIERTRADARRVQTELHKMNVGRPARGLGIATAIAALTPRVALTSVTQEGDTYTITGRAGSQALVLDYARALQASAHFARVQIVSMLNTDPLGVAPDVQFAIETTRQFS